ncbi:hypothetical protein BLNAU_17017 [Blattamonas nauphoetae]|uniref:Uncharacterized protein n=1 Tax=Blattamonas nauphoetae TaxID=2049346 RepID=A0ABQ9XCW9_9EUKA|nr:hypothetical protein BLNAU_17017 [Blattamonas nauphoetae]
MEELTLACTVLGDVAVGKSSLIRALGAVFQESEVNEFYSDFELKTAFLQQSNSSESIQQIVFYEPSPNQDSSIIRCVTESFMILLCFSLDSESSFSSLSTRWYPLIENLPLPEGRDPPRVFLIGTKSDLSQEFEVDPEYASNLAQLHHSQLICVSTVDNENIRLLRSFVGTLVKRIEQEDHPWEEEEEEDSYSQSGSPSKSRGDQNNQTDEYVETPEIWDAPSQSEQHHDPYWQQYETDADHGRANQLWYEAEERRCLGEEEYKQYTRLLMESSLEDEKRLLEDQLRASHSQKEREAMERVERSAMQVEEEFQQRLLQEEIKQQEIAESERKRLEEEEERLREEEERKQAEEEQKQRDLEEERQREAERIREEEEYLRTEEERRAAEEHRLSVQRWMEAEETRKMAEEETFQNYRLQSEMFLAREKRRMEEEKEREAEERIEEERRKEEERRRREEQLQREREDKERMEEYQRNLQERLRLEGVERKQMKLEEDIQNTRMRAEQMIEEEKRRMERERQKEEEKRKREEERKRKREEEHRWKEAEERKRKEKEESKKRKEEKQKEKQKREQELETERANVLRVEREAMEMAERTALQLAEEFERRLKKEEERRLENEELERQREAEEEEKKRFDEELKREEEARREQEEMERQRRDEEANRIKESRWKEESERLKMAIEDQLSHQMRRLEEAQKEEEERVRCEKERRRKEDSLNRQRMKEEEDRRTAEREKNEKAEQKALALEEARRNTLLAKEKQLQQRKLEKELKKRQADQERQKENAENELMKEEDTRARLLRAREDEERQKRREDQLRIEIAAQAKENLIRRLKFEEEERNAMKNEEDALRSLQLKHSDSDPSLRTLSSHATSHRSSGRHFSSPFFSNCSVSRFDTTTDGKVNPIYSFSLTNHLHTSIDLEPKPRKTIFAEELEQRALVSPQTFTLDRTLKTPPPARSLLNTRPITSRTRRSANMSPPQTARTRMTSKTERQTPDTDSSFSIFRRIQTDVSAKLAGEGEWSEAVKMELDPAASDEEDAGQQTTRTERSSEMSPIGVIHAAVQKGKTVQIKVFSNTNAKVLAKSIRATFMLSKEKEMELRKCVEGILKRWEEKENEKRKKEEEKAENEEKRDKHDLDTIDETKPQPLKQPRKSKKSKTENSDVPLSTRRTTQSQGLRTQRHILFKLNVQLGHGRTGIVVVRKGDDPERIAQSFCVRHKLESGNVEKIREMIEGYACMMEREIVAERNELAQTAR